jgi:hypothetical protein
MAGGVIEYYPKSVQASEKRLEVPGLFITEDPHDVRWRASRFEFISHESHIRVDVAEKVFVSGTEVIEAGFTVRRMQEAMLGAFPITRESDIAFPAHSRQ